MLPGMRLCSSAPAELAVLRGSCHLSWHLFGCSPVVTALVASGRIVGSRAGRITVGEVAWQPWRELGLICEGDHADARPVTASCPGKPG